MPDSKSDELSGEYPPETIGMKVEMTEVSENGENSQDEIEDGELDESSTPMNYPVFEIAFRNKSDFENLGEHLLSVLRKNFNPTLGGKQFEFFKTNILETEEADNQTGDKQKTTFCIQAFEKITDTTTEAHTEIKTAMEIEEDSNSDQNSNDSQDFGMDLNKLFTIDPSPSTVLESAKVPSYKRASKELLDVESKTKCKKTDENACARPKAISTCFNCGDQGHGLRDCPMPRDAKRINRAKKAHTAKGERYHVDCEQKYAHLRPGVISEKLKGALRLRRGEIPPFFYRMRKFGYPPGWLEDAKVSHSGLAMFNSNADVLKSEENNDDEDIIKYDMTKLIEFPGFNSKPEGSFYDDYKYHNVPPLDNRHMKEEMINALGENVIKGYKLKKIKDNATGSEEIIIIDSNDDIKPHDMEIDDGDAVEIVEFSRPPPPTDDIKNGCEAQPPKPPTPPPTATSPLLEITPPLISTPQERAESPTLDELQAKQKALLLKLENGEEDGQTDDDDVILLPTTESSSSCSTNNNSIPIASDTPATVPETPPTPSTPSTPLPCEIESKKIIKSSHMGTPVLKFSPFEKLPAGDNFKVGVSDVINFENLPDSTGKYEAMKEVIIKVRKIKKRLNAEDN